MPQEFLHIVQQARSVQAYARLAYTDKKLLESGIDSAKNTNRLQLSASKAKLKTLSLEELRGLYNDTTMALRQAGSKSHVEFLHLARNLVREEVRRRGISLYELFLSGSEIGVKP